MPCLVGPQVRSRRNGILVAGLLLIVLPSNGAANLVDSKTSPRQLAEHDCPPDDPNWRSYNPYLNLNGAPAPPFPCSSYSKDIHLSNYFFCDIDSDKNDVTAAVACPNACESPCGSTSSVGGVTCDVDYITQKLAEVESACCTDGGDEHGGKRILQTDCSLPDICPSVACAIDFTTFFKTCGKHFREDGNPSTALITFNADCGRLLASQSEPTEVDSNGGSDSCMCAYCSAATVDMNTSLQENPPNCIPFKTGPFARRFECSCRSRAWKQGDDTKQFDQQYPVTLNDPPCRREEWLDEVILTQATQISPQVYDDADEVVDIVVGGTVIFKWQGFENVDQAMFINGTWAPMFDNPDRITSGSPNGAVNDFAYRFDAPGEFYFLSYVHQTLRIKVMVHANMLCQVISGYEPAHGDAQDSELFMVAISSQTAGNYTLRVVNNVDLGFVTVHRGQVVHIEAKSTCIDETSSTQSCGVYAPLGQLPLLSGSFHVLPGARLVLSHMHVLNAPNIDAGGILNADNCKIDPNYSPHGVFPAMVTMWSGQVANVPKGWVACDGQNGTPDLRDKFIVAAGNQAPAGSATRGTIGAFGDATDGSIDVTTTSRCTGGDGGCRSHNYVTDVTYTAASNPYYAILFIMKTF